MAISRRMFLKAGGIGSLTNLVLGSKESQTIEKETNSEGRFEYDLALHDLDFAEIYLKGLINREYTGPHQTHASNLDSATRFVHTNI